MEDSTTQDPKNFAFKASYHHHKFTNFQKNWKKQPKKKAGSFITNLSSSKLSRQCKKYHTQPKERKKMGSSTNNNTTRVKETNWPRTTPFFLNN
jgi:hypothetical protein